MQIDVIASGQSLGVFASPEEVSAVLNGRSSLFETTFELHFTVPAKVHLIRKDGTREEINTDAEGRANLVLGEDGELVVFKNKDGMTTTLALTVPFADEETDEGYVMPKEEFSRSASLARDLIDGVRERLAKQIFDRTIC
jgi:carbon monoxide dehydrogenase subunit G